MIQQGRNFVLASGIFSQSISFLSPVSKVKEGFALPWIPFDISPLDHFADENDMTLLIIHAPLV